MYRRPAMTKPPPQPPSENIYTRGLQSAISTNFAKMHLNSCSENTRSHSVAGFVRRLEQWDNFRLKQIRPSQNVLGLSCSRLHVCWRHALCSSPALLCQAQTRPLHMRNMRSFRISIGWVLDFDPVQESPSPSARPSRSQLHGLLPLCYRTCGVRVLHRKRGGALV